MGRQEPENVGVSLLGHDPVSVRRQKNPESLRQQTEARTRPPPAADSDDAVSERLDPVRLALQPTSTPGTAKADRCASCSATAWISPFGPIVDLAQLREHEIDDFRIAFEEFFDEKIELIIETMPLPWQRPRAGGASAGRLKRIPDHPCIDHAASNAAGRRRGRERRARFGYLMRLLQRLHQEVGTLEPLFSATFLPFKSATIERAVLRNQDRFALRRRRS